MKASKTWVMAALIGTAACWMPWAAAAEPKPEVIIAAVSKLKPGEFLWLPEVAPDGPVLVMVSLTTQRAVVYRNGIPIGVSTVSSGKDGHQTPTGIFTILQRKVAHKSNLYDDAPMPYMQRLTWDGIALHAGNLPGYRASHGCIRFPLEFAKRLYSVTNLGLTVVVTKDAALPRVAPSPNVLASSESAPVGTSADEVLWKPEVSPTGPVSVIVSAADSRVIVLRNGKEIGSAPVEIRASVQGTAAYSLQALGPEGPVWLKLSLPGAGPRSDAESLHGKIGVDERFRQAVFSVIKAGTTVVVTADSLRQGSLGEEVKLELAEPHQ